MIESIANELEIEHINPEINYAISPFLFVPVRSEMGLDDRNQIEETKKLLHKRRRKDAQFFTCQRMIKERNRIAIDAREIDAGGEKIWVWAAVDLKDNTVMATCISYVKNRATTYSFLKNVAGLCKGTLPNVFVNGENWYPWAFEKLGFRYIAVAFDSKCVAEGFLSEVSSKICTHFNKSLL